MSLTFGSIFSGIAGWDLGLERAGLQCRWMVEIDPVCRSVLARHWPDVPCHEDVCDVGAHNLEPVDVIVFSAPCQDLSVAGKRAGLDGARSGLYFEAIRVIRELRPAIAAYEQVPGLLSSNRGRDFGRALDALADIGALDIGWSVLDARWWKVAQRRRRLYVVADFTDRRASQILALADGLSGHPAPRREAWQATAAGSSGGTGSGGGAGVIRTGGDYADPYLTIDDQAFLAANPMSDRQMAVFHPAPSDDNGSNHVVASAITASAGHHGHSSPRGDGSDNLVIACGCGHVFTGELTTACPSCGQIRDAQVTTVAFNWQAGGSKDFTSPTEELSSSLTQRQTPAIFESRNGRGAPEAGRPPLKAQSGQTGKGDSAPLVMGMTVRRLTPVECEKLMALPPGWTEYGVDGPIADSHRYRMLGNSVVANVAEWIGRRLMEALS